MLMMVLLLLGRSFLSRAAVPAILWRSATYVHMSWQLE